MGGQKGKWFRLNTKTTHKKRLDFVYTSALMIKVELTYWLMHAHLHSHTHINTSALHPPTHTHRWHRGVQTVGIYINRKCIGMEVRDCSQGPQFVIISHSVALSLFILLCLSLSHARQKCPPHSSVKLEVLNLTRRKRVSHVSPSSYITNN